MARGDHIFSVQLLPKRVIKINIIHEVHSIQAQACKNVKVVNNIFAKIGVGGDIQAGGEKIQICLLPSRITANYIHKVWPGDFWSKSVSLILAYQKMFRPFAVLMFFVCLFLVFFLFFVSL